MRDTAINQTMFFSGTRIEARMVMKSGGRYRRDNIPLGRVFRSRRCQRRQAIAKPNLTSAISRIPSFLRSTIMRYTCSLRCVRAPRGTIFLLVFSIVLPPITGRIAPRAYLSWLIVPSRSSNVSKLFYQLGPFWMEDGFKYFVSCFLWMESNC